MKKLIFFAILVVVSVGATGYSFGKNQSTQPPRTSAASEKPLIDYINQIRAENKLTPLHEDPALDETAKAKAEDLAERNYWDHTTPDGKPFYFAMQQKRPGLHSYGENLAECYTSNPATVEAWVKSPGHLENIVKPDYTIFGSYSVWDQDKTCLITVNHFGKE